MAGKKKRAASKEKRRKEKKARKEAQKARYKKYAEMGINTKSKRSNKRTKAVKRIHAGHGPDKCGNAGCIRCHGLTISKLFFKDGKPHGMPHWMYLRWQA